MAEQYKATKLDHEAHLFLDLPLLRLPSELLRKNFKTAQSLLEREIRNTTTEIMHTTNNSLRNEDPAATLRAIDTLLSRLKTLRSKLVALQQEEKALHESTRHRLEHLQCLYSIPDLNDVKYNEWSRVRLDRFLVEYLVRQGYVESARALAREKDIEHLVDLETFARCERVASALRVGSLEECLAWCSENRVMMKKTGDNRLEFELRLQQYIELWRQKKQVEAREHGRKYFTPYMDTQLRKILWASGLLSFPADQQTQYSWWYSQARWDELANLFTDTHHQLYSLPSRPLLLIALSAGLSALKTPSCHSKHASSTANASSTTTSVCPICSTELNELARKLPYAHHTKSSVEPDPVVLPNGRVYGQERLERYCRKVGMDEQTVKDPTTSDTFSVHEVRKVFIT